MKYPSLACISLIFVLVGSFAPKVVDAQPTGDSFVDGKLNEFPFQKKGGNNSPPSLGPGNYPNDVKDCNSATAPAHEASCPSDLLYTPNSNTGGYQAYGVGISNLPGGTYWYGFCFPNWFYPDDYIYVYWECYWYPIQIPDMAYGVAASRVRFGSNTTSSPWSLKPMSTLAFKANSVYLPVDVFVECDPDFSISPAGAPCDDSDQNVYAVPDAGYEDKIVIRDYGCTGIRLGTPSDATKGCFVRDLISPANWYSNLPAAYPDTTFLDDNDYYNPGFGSADPTAIIEGVNYLWYTGFYQYGLESTAPHEIRHIASVTTYVDPSPVGCNALEPWDCYFQVDQTNIAPTYTIP